MPSNSNGRRQIVVVEAPAHPVSQLQGPFEESMFESQSTGADENDVPIDAGTRRNMLLEAPTYQRVIAGRWKQKPGEKFHPLWKLVAQMSFGIHLLSEGMAKSEEDVFQILQNHVDDIDIFLERTTEDFTLAQDDIQERLKCLKLPLQHPDVFERMLEDRTFRNSIVEGNEKIEHIVTRTGSAMKDALKDVQKGFDSSSALEKYLTGLDTTWVRKTQEHEAVFVAMLGNVEGWKKAFLDLHMQGNKLAGSLRKLTEVVNQMQQKAGEVSRRLVRQQHRQGGSIANSSSFTYHSRQQSPNRSSSRQQQGSAASKRVPGRHHSRNGSKEAPRADSSQSQTQRSGTGLSMRSTGEVRTETPSSRSASRTDTPLSGLDPARMNIGSPRVVYVKNQMGHHRADSVSASVRNESALSNRSATPQHQLRPQESTISMLDQATPKVIEPKQFAPVELPAEIPPEAFLQAPLSNRNRLSGLGFLPSERRAQAATASHAFNPATALVELLRDPSRYSKLPLTPSSATSPSIPASALSALEGKKHLTVDAQAVRREPTPERTPPVGGDSNSDSTPATPAWASQVVDDAERQRVLAEKIPFSTRTPQIGTTDDISSATPRFDAAKSAQPKLDTTVEGSVTSSTGAENSSAKPPSELSAGYENGLPSLPNLSRQQAEAAMMINTPETTTKTRKKLSFIAELEGSEPVFLPSTVYTPILALAKVTETHELDGSDSYFSLPIQLNTDDHVSTVISELSSDRNSKMVTLDEATLAAATTEQIQIVLEEVTRKSFSDAEIPVFEPPPVPETTAAEISELPTQMTPKPRQSDPFHGPEADSPSRATSKEVSTSSPAVVSTMTLAQDSKSIEENPAAAVLAAVVPSGKVLSAPIKPLDTPTTEAVEVEEKKGRPVTTIHSPPDAEQAKLLLPVTPGFVTANSSPNFAIDADKKDTVKARPTSGVQRSASETKITLGRTRLSVFPPLRSPPAPLNTKASPSSPASAPDTATRPSPKSSQSANSPASLMSVRSAPVTDLTRGTTKESRKQWKAFFSGQLKSPKSSPAASIKSLKSPSASIASSHKHTNSQASQTNASIKTLWLSSPVLTEPPAKDSIPETETEIETETKTEIKPAEVEPQAASTSDEKRPSVIDNRQPSSPTLGFSQPTIGLGLDLITSPTVRSPTSALETPVIATATASTAFARQVPRAVSATLVTRAVPATTSTFISNPKPRVIEVRRKAVGSGINSGSGSRPSSAADNDKRDSTSEDKTRSVISVDSRSGSPMLTIAQASETRIDNDATPRIDSTIDSKPKLTVETLNTPRQAYVVQMAKPISVVGKARLSDSSTTSSKPQSQTERAQEEVKQSESQTESTSASITQVQSKESRIEASLSKSEPEATTTITTTTITNPTPITNHQRQPSEQFTKGHERDSSDDNYDFLDAYA